VLFAHAHILKRRPTIIADELPKLTDHQIATLTERYDIHGGAADAEASNTFGAAVNSGEPDTTLPPAEASEYNNLEKPTRSPGDVNHESTRQSSVDSGTVVGDHNEKGPRV
jgi:hypothetical protein